MRDNFERALQEVLKHEGGFVNHPRDPGGATNKGITIDTYRRYVNRDGDITGLLNITSKQVASIYKKQYWDKVKGDLLPSGLDFAVFDFAVNSGVSRAAKYLQKLVGVSQDGKIGPMTLRAVGKYDASRLVESLLNDRLAFLMRLSHWETFGKGWSRRVRGVRLVSRELTGGVTKPRVKKQRPSAGKTESPTKQKPTLWQWLLKLLNKGI